ncbi:hypothetical protein EXIGLDRAFT_766697 [Exidia glandulosa HHB12029]|uniref:Ubiquitin-like domain-containing protein n=1 Tax=Exidia glandulosa HHB12029 TaxID=1314781 RepID=A0A165JKJ4_EXIGL|nr:hypothetical protein EXIGLDRAFT_766697 [Exidia glandulosa HHB12029]
MSEGSSSMLAAHAGLEPLDDGPTASPTPAHVELRQTQLTFLLVSGRRRTMAFDDDATVGRVKELLWNTWPADWQDERPPAPNYLRVLYLGKMLQDDETLVSLKLPPWTAPTIMHLSVRPTPPTGGDDGAKKHTRGSILRRATDASSGPGADDDASGGGCCCVIC